MKSNRVGTETQEAFNSLLDPVANFDAGYKAGWQAATAAERERAAKVAEDMGWLYNPIADAIRKGEPGQ